VENHKGLKQHTIEITISFKTLLSKCDYESLIVFVVVIIFIPKITEASLKSFISKILNKNSLMSFPQKKII
jgi:hypothetical protein